MSQNISRSAISVKGLACAGAVVAAVAVAPAFADANVETFSALAADPASATRTIRVGAALADVETELTGFNLLERFALQSPIGRIDYLAVRAGSEGSEPAFLFVNGTLDRIIAADDRRTFAACRTLATSRGAHWMGAGGVAGFDALVAPGGLAEVRLAPPAGSLGQVLTEGAGKGIGSLESLVSLVPTSLNPAAIPRAVRGLVRSAKDEAQSAQRIEVLKRMPLGMSETSLVAELGVDWARVENGTPLLWYRKESFEVLVKDGRVAGVEFPARNERIARNAGGYYEAGIDWTRCPAQGAARSGL